MTAATVYADRAKATAPVRKPIGSGICSVAWGVYEVADNPEDGDIWKMCRVPRDGTVVGGWFYGDELDTGTDALDIDIGWAANGTDVADPDGFGNLGVITGAAITGLKPVAGIMYPFQGVLLTEGPKTFAAETVVQLEANVAAHTGGTGTISLVTFYTCD